MFYIKSIFILFIIFIYSLCYAQEENFDVRKVKWGMTQDEVLNSELPNKPFKRMKDSFAYNEKIDNKNSLIIYQFKDNKLYQVVYKFDINNSREDNLFKMNIISILEKKYIKNQEISENPLLRGLVEEFYNNNTSINIFTKNKEIIISYQSLESKNESEKESNINFEKRKKEMEKVF